MSETEQRQRVKPGDADTVRLLYDVKLRRPGCVLLQAVAGGDTHTLNILFDSRTWLVHPTPDMKMIRGTREEWQRAAKLEPR